MFVPAGFFTQFSVPLLWQSEETLLQATLTLNLFPILESLSAHLFLGKDSSRGEYLIRGGQNLLIERLKIQVITQVSKVDWSPWKIGRQKRSGNEKVTNLVDNLSTDSYSIFDAEIKSARKAEDIEFREQFQGFTFECSVKKRGYLLKRRENVAKCSFDIVLVTRKQRG